MNIKGKTALITGGGSGIGLEAARQFLELGARVIITGRNQNKLDEAQRQLPQLIAIKSDVASAVDNLALYQKVQQIGGIDILYNNAGLGVPPSNLGMADKKHWEDAALEMEVNYLGVIRLNDLFLDMLKARNESAIINTTSILSYVPSLLEATYSASKTALSFYTRSFREHLKIVNSTVKVFELLPPLVETAMTAGRDDKKISPEKLVRALIKGLQNDTLTIRVGDTKAIYLINRLFPRLAFRLVNPEKSHQLVR